MTRGLTARHSGQVEESLSPQSDHGWKKAGSRSCFRPNRDRPKRSEGRTEGAAAGGPGAGSAAVYADGGMLGEPRRRVDRSWRVGLGSAAVVLRQKRSGHRSGRVDCQRSTADTSSALQVHICGWPAGLRFTPLRRHSRSGKASAVWRPGMPISEIPRSYIAPPESEPLLPLLGPSLRRRCYLRSGDIAMRAFRQNKPPLLLRRCS
jgi:hypothetical protein